MSVAAVLLQVIFRRAFSEVHARFFDSEHYEYYLTYVYAQVLWWGVSCYSGSIEK